MRLSRDRYRRADWVNDLVRNLSPNPWPGYWPNYGAILFGTNVSGVRGPLKHGGDFFFRILYANAFTCGIKGSIPLRRHQVKAHAYTDAQNDLLNIA